MEICALRRLVSLPKEDPQFDQELIYGIRMTIVENSIEYGVTVTRHPDQDRFLMVISLLNRRYWIIDLKSLEIQQENHENEGLYQLQRNKYFIFVESGKWIFTFKAVQECNQRLAQFINLQKIVRQKKGSDDQYDPRLLKLFMRYNANEDEFIDDNELTEVLANFDIQFDETVRNCVKEIAPKCKQGLLKEEFHTLMKVLLCKRELALLFRKFCPTFSQENLLGSIVHFCLTPLMQKSQLISFLTQEQGMTKQEIDQIIPSIEIVQDKVSFHSFCKFMFSDANSILNSNRTKVYQDMDQPLTEYYVHSSHNTYLVGNQLTSDSKAFRYIEDFYDGVRCVELDIHDGRNGPIIKHGFTFTAPVSFRAVIQAIGDYSRQNEGHLPLILSFQNHCSIQNQIEMAKILKECLGQKIYVVPESCSNKHTFPSPNALRNKIVIQGTGILDNIRPNILRAKMEMTASRYQRVATTKAFEQLSTNYPQEFRKGKEKFSEWCKNITKEKNVKTAKLQEEILSQRKCLEVPSQVQLMQYYSIFVSKMDVDQACWEMGNISEANALNHISDANRMKNLVQFSKKCHVRVYPQGTRFGSSNFNPIPMYEAGAQLVSLNTQSEDIFNMVMVGNFLENGGKKGGYLLKPNHLRTQDSYSVCHHQLNIRIISVHSISNNYEDSCAIQVNMCLVCSRADEVLNNTCCQMVEATQKKEKIYYQTQFPTVREFNYTIKELDFAHVYFQIPTCGHISVPVRMMRTGYRVIPLLDRNKQFKPSSYIFAHITLKKKEM